MTCGCWAILTILQPNKLGGRIISFTFVGISLKIKSVKLLLSLGKGRKQRWKFKKVFF